MIKGKKKGRKNLQSNSAIGGFQGETGGDKKNEHLPGSKFRVRTKSR